MSLAITQVDAFTSKPFSGNPAAVCVLSEERDAAWMQNVAQEMNLAETAFLLPVSRFFAPAAGIDEDPVTGSAHCCLAPLWSRRLNKNSFRARQISARGGELKVELAGDRVRLAGQAVTVLRAELLA